MLKLYKHDANFLKIVSNTKKNSFENLYCLILRVSKFLNTYSFIHWAP